MSKYFSSLLAFIIRIRTGILFLLLCLSISFPSSAFRFSGVINIIIENIGYISLLLWLYAISYHSNKKLINDGININLIQYFNLTITLFTTFLVLKQAMTTREVIKYNTFNVYYYKPFFIAIVLLTTYILTLFISAKFLVSAEISNNSNLKKFFSTFLLLLFFPIGIWFIQPRVRKIMRDISLSSRGQRSDTEM